MHNFDYHRPAKLADAATLLSEREDAKLLAGGMSLLPTLKHRLTQYSDLVDLGAVSELTGITREKDAIVIGAMTRHVVVSESEVVRDAIPALAALAGGIGDPLVRNRGTIGGSLANSDPGADYPGGVRGLGATLITDRREIFGDDYFLGLFETALAPGEIIAAVRFPIPKRAGYTKFMHPASRFALVGVMVAEAADGIRVGVTGAGPCAFRWTDAEQALAKNFAPEALDGVALDDENLNTDMHASAEYRAHLVGVLVRQSVRKARGETVEEA